MAKTLPIPLQHPTKAYKFELHHPQKPYKSSTRSLIAIFFLFFSMLAYTTIFYISNVSPSTLFYNTKFWFLISNTLILIIAFDYSSSTAKYDQIDYQEEYMMHRQAQITSSFVSEYPRQPRETIKETIANHATDSPTASESPVSLCPRTPLFSTCTLNRNPPQPELLPSENIENPENWKVTVLKDEHDEKPSVDELDVKETRVIQVQSKGGKKENRIQAQTYKRSKSEEVKRAVKDECKSIVRRSETTPKHRETQASTPEEDNEFSAMSDEELKRRCEDFIRKFNEHIRCQSVADRVPTITYHQVCST